MIKEKQMQLGAIIKKLREDKGLTQEELAKHINSTKQTILNMRKV